MLDLTDHVMVLCWSVLSWHLKRTLHPRVLQSLCNLLDSCRGVQPFDIAKQCYQPPGLCCRTVQSSCQRKTWKGGLVGKAHSIQAREPNFRSLNPCFKKKKSRACWVAREGRILGAFWPNRLTELVHSRFSDRDYLTMWLCEKCLRKTTYTASILHRHMHVCAHPINVCPYLRTHECIHKSHKTLF